MTTLPRVIFFGNERLVSGLIHTEAPILSGLIERGYDVAAVVSNYEAGSSRSARNLEVAEIAHTHNIPLYLPKKPIEIIDELIGLKADFAILSAYGRIVSQRIIDVFSPIGIINVHPSLLPRHRGSTPIETTILADDHVAGVSIMQLSAGMDEGPVYGQVSMSLRGNETKFELYGALSAKGAELLFGLLPDITNGNLQPIQQQISDVSYTSLIAKSDGIVDPSTDTAEDIERKVRAYLNYPKTKLTFKDKDVIITSVKVIDTLRPNHLVLTCKNNSYLLVETLVAPNGKQMSGEAYLRGLR